MGVITISIGPTYRKTPSNYAEVREKLGQYQCKACQRIYGEHTDEELDKCMDEMSPIRKLGRERQKIEFHFPDNEYSREEIKALSDQVIEQVMKHEKARSKRIGAELKAHLDKHNQT